MALYLIGNGPAPTTASFASVSTGTSLITMLQVKPGATQSIAIVEYGVSFDGSAAATPGKIELIETDVAATVTAHVAAGLTKLDSDAINSGDPTTNIFSVGTSATGYTSSGEGSITAVRNLAAPQFVAPTNQFVMQFPLGQEPIIQPAKFMRIRLLFGAAVNAYCYVKVRA